MNDNYQRYYFFFNKFILMIFLYQRILFRISVNGGFFGSDRYVGCVGYKGGFFYDVFRFIFNFYGQLQEIRNVCNEDFENQLYNSKKYIFNI